jgi:hypothetical protein
MGLQIQGLDVYIPEQRFVEDEIGGDIRRQTAHGKSPLLPAFAEMGVKEFTLLGGEVKFDFDLMQQGTPVFFRMFLEEFGKGADGLFHFVAGALGRCGHGLCSRSGNGSKDQSGQWRDGDCGVERGLGKGLGNGLIDDRISTGIAAAVLGIV